MNTKTNSDFRFDLEFGKEGERSVANVLSIETVEVKRDDKWFQTGNLYIETECWYNSSQSWKPSGLNTTESTHWAFVLDDLIVILPTDELARIVVNKGRAVECNIPPNPSRGYLITLKDLTDHIKGKRT